MTNEKIKLNETLADAEQFLSEAKTYAAREDFGAAGLRLCWMLELLGEGITLTATLTAKGKQNENE